MNSQNSYSYTHNIRASSCQSQFLPDLPRVYSRNKRGIAGNLVWINSDRDSLLVLIESAAGKFIADVDGIRPQFNQTDMISPSQQAIFQTSVVRSYGPSVGSTIDQLDNLTLTGVSSLTEAATPWLHDQILPFDITLAGTNEYGAATAMKIFGVEILNSGGGNSIETPSMSGRQPSLPVRLSPGLQCPMLIPV